MSRYDYLLDFLDEEKPKVIAEVGTWRGVFARKMLKASKATKYIGFDLWEQMTDDLKECEFDLKKTSTKEEAEKNLQEVQGVEIELIQGNTRETIPNFLKETKPFVDFCFIDGGHSVGTLKSDIGNCIHMMNTGGVIFIDDYYFGNPRADVGANNVMGDMSIPFTIMPSTDVIEDPVGKYKYQVKLARILMTDVPRYRWEEGATQEWRFDPAAA